MIFFLASLTIAFVAIASFLAFGTFWPKKREELPLTDFSEAVLKVGESAEVAPLLKILTWNVQFFAGKKRCFFFDVPGGSGPDTRPSSEEIRETIEGAARLLRERDADVVFLQEVDQGAVRTGREDQLARLLDLIGRKRYPWVAQTFYWKAGFVPHPKIWGSVGMKLVTLSKLPLEPTAIRWALPEMPHSWLERRFQLKRAMLESIVSCGPWKGLRLLNTHLDAFAQGFDTMEQQVEVVARRLETLDREALPWCMGGDFNLLMPGARATLVPPHQGLYRQPSEIQRLLSSFVSFPSQAELSSSTASRFFTYFSNDPAIGRPDRALDYIFYSKLLSRCDADVFQDTAQGVSYHFPVEL